MAVQHTLSYKIALATILTIANASAEVPRLRWVGDDILQGFKASAVCFTGSNRPSQWCVAFKVLLQTRKRESASFFLGANLGFSLTSESSAEFSGAPPGELRGIAACAVLSRLKYEEIKKRLNLSDAQIIKILSIRPGKFAAWKARNKTHDSDQSVTNPHAGTEL